MASEVVSYGVDGETVVKVEIEPTAGFRPASPGQIVGQVARAAEPAIEAARVIIEKIKKAKPTEAKVKFGVKVSGGSDWFVAKTSAEANFEITVTWKADPNSAA
ncbi:hypothetical protein MUY14_38865 [Amycolatopsis sp. FBCC-B4732]|uniref:CU044_2847 family protein n=1 Tax=Amycolatopsis sp. FBCC-B4732 TaxID=3079339 RepID=UPI001FF4B0D5|nr:CU044_2847 family protein [Amycolatopsis sp. FBCC-B4732]UOX87626.1 hypothetical protein MUY14_38865 [Amycolatopsis sp. FBCC-B4732]